MEAKLKQGNDYIVSTNSTSNSIPTTAKIFVIELTDKSIYLYNSDENIKYRELIKDFHKEWIVVEDLGASYKY